MHKILTNIGLLSTRQKENVVNFLKNVAEMHVFVGDFTSPYNTYFNLLIYGFEL